MKYAFIGRHRRVWPVSVQCRVLGVSVAGYHAHLVRRAGNVQRRHLSNDALLVHIKGHPCRSPQRLRLAAHLARAGGARYPGGQRSGTKAHAVARHQGQVQTALQGHHRQPARSADLAQLLDREFTVAEPDRVWFGDITLNLVGVAIRYRRTRRGQHGLHVRLRAWDVDVAPRLTFAPIRDRTVAKASPCAMSLH